MIAPFDGYFSGFMTRLIRCVLGGGVIILLVCLVIGKQGNPRASPKMSEILRWQIYRTRRSIRWNSLIKEIKGGTHYGRAGKTKAQK
jgi:hypothetical protein